MRESGPLVQKVGVVGHGLGHPVARNVNVYLSKMSRYQSITKIHKDLRILSWTLKNLNRF